MILSIVVVVYPSMSYSPSYASLFMCFCGCLRPFIFPLFKSSKHALHTCLRASTASVVATHRVISFFAAPFPIYDFYTCSFF